MSEVMETTTVSEKSFVEKIGGAIGTGALGAVAGAAIGAGVRMAANAYFNSGHEGISLTSGTEYAAISGAGLGGTVGTIVGFADKIKLERSEQVVSGPTR